MYRSANVSAGRAGGRRWAQQHPPPAGARSADARAPPQVLLRSWSRLTRAPSYATPSRPDRTNCRKAFHWPHRPASSWYHFSWRNLHRRANADSLFGTNVEITPPSISNHFCYGTRHKPAMVYAGKWRALKPEMTSHRSFKINALVSLLPNASWATLVKEYYDAKRGGPSRMQVFHNPVLGRPWRTTINRVDASMLADRAEPWGLPTSGHGVIVPEDVMVITAGVDTQDDRVECVLIGFPVYGAPCILGHVVFAGNTLEDGVWCDLDRFLKTRWRHPNGWMIGIDGAAIDSGGREGRTQKVYDFAFPRMGAPAARLEASNVWAR